MESCIAANVFCYPIAEHNTSLSPLDPEVCTDGFTFHFTLKIYANSVNSAKELYIVDSGAVSKDSRGVSVWVTEGKR